MLRSLFCVLALSLLAADKAKDDTGKKEQEKFQGTWTTVSIEYNGRTFDDVAKELRFIFKGASATVEGSDKIKAEYAKFSFKIDPTSTPKCFDLTITAGSQKDNSMEGIYEFKGDELRLCIMVVGKERPSKFEAPEGASTCIVVLKREKK